MEDNASIRHARYYGRAACLASSVARQWSQRKSTRPGRLGLICNGGPWSLQASWDFVARAREVGARYVNPLQFPPTLISATGTAAATAADAHAFAYVVGWDRFAFFDVLHRAGQAVRHHLADEVLSIAISTSNPAISLAAKRAGLPEPVNVALGFALSEASENADFWLLDIGYDESVLAKYPLAQRYDAYYANGSLSFTIPVPLVGGEAYGATAAVLIMSAMTCHKALQTPKNRDFALTFREEKHFAFAVFRLG
ncbi:MAG: hypothetical protein LAO78_06555 [Acidobacteriia bacterium]|nr:hypothetical protein [Terriglobia bacterium]